MKQKVVIKVQMDCEKCRSKALKIAAVAKGVSSVSLEGDDKDKVAVTGDGVDSFCLTKALRKKFGHANIVSIEEVKGKDKKDKKGDETKIIPIPWNYAHYPPYVPSQYDEYGSSCIVM
ncbi:hypothetical protein Fmac_030491 [Flemingia macrophylla]|uniref:HMA domain-containing protein n=1 Tax=Flemingia macrophylla TaxID=520843 RepID=A0ABD1KZC7_9FABA